MVNPIAQTLQPFVWGRGGARLTPEQIAREREIAEALGAVDTSPVGHWLEGAARLGNAFAGRVREGRADRAQTENLEEGRGRLQGIADLLAGGSPVVSGAPPVASQPLDLASARVAQAHMPTGERAGYIRQGLVQRGLPEHVADAFLMNFQDESGLDPGINERNPIVPGSRGGFGLYQLTGPRRRAYESFANQRGVDPSDIDAQLDFMMTELQGPEARAAGSILTAPDTGTAAAAIVNDFLRPSERHRSSREARYLQSAGAPPAVDAVNAMAQGGMQDLLQRGPVQGSMETLPFDPASAQGMAMEPLTPPSQPMPPAAMMQPPAGTQPRLPQPQQPQPGMQPEGGIFLGTPEELAAQRMATSLTAHPVNPDVPMAGGAQGFAPVEPDMQMAQALAGEQPQQQSQGGLMQALIESMSSPYASDQERQIAGILFQQQMQQQDPYRQAQLEQLQLQNEGLRNPQPDGTNNMRNYEYLLSQGVSPEDALGRAFSGGVTVNNMPSVGSPPTGYENVYDDQGRILRQDMIEGGPAWQEQQDRERAAESRRANLERTSGTLIQDVGRALEMVENGGLLTSGRGGRIGRLDPESSAAALEQMVESIRGTIGFDELQALRDASPTGAATGNLNARELDALQGLAGRLDPFGDQKVFTENLKRIQNIYMDKLHGTPQQIMEAYQRGQVNPQTGMPLTLEDIEPLLFRYDLSFDERGRSIDRDQGDSDIEDLLRKYGG